MKKRKKLWELVLPNKRINFFVITVIILGILSGSIFLMMLSSGDKESVVLRIKDFFLNISSINRGQAFCSSLIINYLFVGIIWILGFSLIGVLFNIFLIYIRGFLVGFSISSIFLTFGYKGVVASLIYCFPSQILNLIVGGIISIYSFMFSFHLIRIIISKSKREGAMLKRYFFILMISIIISFISSLFEVYVFPNILKMVIGIYS